jgi:hypothetical protein
VGTFWSFDYRGARFWHNLSNILSHKRFPNFSYLEVTIQDGGSLWDGGDDDDDEGSDYRKEKAGNLSESFVGLLRRKLSYLEECGVSVIISNELIL